MVVEYRFLRPQPSELKSDAYFGARFVDGVATGTSTDKVAA